MKTLKKAFKNIIAFLLLLVAVLWITPSLLFLLIKGFFRQFVNFLRRKETHFPRIFTKDFVCGIKNGIKEYFKMELWEQTISCFALIIGFNFILSKWSFKKHNTI